MPPRLLLCFSPACHRSKRFTQRRRVIVISAFVASLLGLVASIAPGIGSMIALRLLQGIVIAGEPVVAMAYVSEEVHAVHVSRVMGLYISGTTVGGLLGRIIPSIVRHLRDPRILALCALSFIAGACAVAGLKPRR